MKPRLFRSLLTLVLLLPATGALADGRWRDLPPDDRQEMRQQMREHWQRENHRKAERDNAQDFRDRREISPDERRRLRDEMREQRGSRDERERRRRRDD